MAWPEYDGEVMRRAVPVLYASLYASMVTEAREQGYALALHGSMTRDMDVIAVPWTQEASDASTLAIALRDEIGGIFANGGPTGRPHGRTVFTIVLDGPLFVDLGVMPIDLPMDLRSRDIPSGDDLREALESIDKAVKTVEALCDGSLKWTMRIPAEPDRDPDLVIADALTKARKVIEALATPTARAPEIDYDGKPIPDDVTEWEWFGCNTGDCPHETTKECAAWKAGYRSRMNDDRLAGPTARAEPGEGVTLCGDGTVALIWTREGDVVRLEAVPNQVPLEPGTKVPNWADLEGTGIPVVTIKGPAALEALISTLEDTRAPSDTEVRDAR